MIGSRQGWVGLVGAALLGLTGGCGQIPDKGDFEKARLYTRIAPPLPANAMGRGNQGGQIPLGASSKYRNTDDRGGSSGLALNGLLNEADVQPPSTEPPQRQARAGGDVAFVPGTFGRRGFGMTARNGSNMWIAGNAHRRTLSYTDPFGVQAAPQLPQSAKPATLGVGGAGDEGRGREK